MMQSISMLAIDLLDSTNPSRYTNGRAQPGIPVQSSVEIGPAARITSTGIAVSRDMPESGSTASGPLAASTFTLTPVVRLATESPFAR